MLKTNLEEIREETETHPCGDEEFDEENLAQYVLDLSLEQKIRLKALQMYYEVHGENTIELISKLTGMYQFSGTKILEKYLHRICTHSRLSNFLKLECVKSLLSFEEWDDTEICNQRNQQRKKKAYRALDVVCYNIQDLPTPYRIEAICSLMECPQYKLNANTYFKEIVGDSSIDCEYRYRTILSLEHKNIPEKQYFIQNACLEMVVKGSQTLYRILASQYLLVKCEPSFALKQEIEEYLLGFAQDRELDTNLRADAADVLLNCGSEANKHHARQIIFELGQYLQARSIFENTQNVHTEQIEQSVVETIEYLTTFPLLEIDNHPIDFEHVYAQILSMLKKEECGICKGDAEKLCNTSCEKLYDKHKKIKVALSRIYTDRALYSRYSTNLSNILLKVWSYLTNHEYEEEIQKRLLEELEDMSGTCSTGFASRLVNVLSGYGQFNIRISWEEQLVGSFTGRLNAMARAIDTKDSVFYGDKKKEVLDLYLQKYPSIGSNPSTLLDLAIKDFKEQVYMEMSISPLYFDKRIHFLLFFRTHMLAIREEMYEEYKDHITDTDFDLYFRKAISKYELG